MGAPERVVATTFSADLPDGWKWLPLKRILVEPLKYGATLTGNDNPTSGPRYIRITDIKAPTRLHSCDVKYLSGKEAQNYLLESGDLLFARSGSVGKSYLHLGGEPSCFAGYLIKAKPKTRELGKWLSYFTQSSIYWEWIALTLNKATVANISAAKFKELLVSIPPEGTLSDLLRFLDAKTAEIDALIDKLARQVKLLERYRRELIAHAVTRGLDPNVPMKDSGVDWIGEIPRAWREISLKSCLRRTSCKNRPDLRVLSVERNRGVVDRNLEGSADNHNRLPEDLSGYQVVSKGQFVMNKMKAWRGAYGVSSYDGIVSPAYYVFDLSTEVPEFFNWAIRSDVYIPFFGMNSFGIRTDQWDFKVSTLREISVFLPDGREQMKIVAFLDRKTREIDATIAGINRQIKLLNKYRKQVIDEVVTGKVRVGEVA